MTKGRRYWLVKSEPDSFSIDDLAKVPRQTTCWDGVRNYQARNFMRQMSVGDQVLFYHSNADPPAVVGSAEVANDRFLGSGSNNMAFILNSVDWLAQDEDLIAIRAKNRAPPPIAYSSGVKRSLARYGNLIGIPVLIIGVGVLRLWRRRRRTGEPYVPGTMADGAA